MAQINHFQLNGIKKPHSAFEVHQEVLKRNPAISCCNRTFPFLNIWKMSHFVMTIYHKDTEGALEEVSTSFRKGLINQFILM